MKVRCIKPVDDLVLNAIYEVRQCPKYSNMFRITTEKYENGGYLKKRFEVIEGLDKSFGAVYYSDKSNQIIIVSLDEENLSLPKVFTENKSFTTGQNHARNILLRSESILLGYL